MILPGLISIAFYKRKPTTLQITLGLVATVVLSGLLGYVSPGGVLGVVGSIIVAIVGGVILYVAILAYFVYRYYPRRANTATLVTPPTPP